ncbi:MAG: Uma2 family endonuclease [Planctomycetes bacterium]|nr:Uma2 family endonuclease [Planctomycetota bacterium]
MSTVTLREPIGESAIELFPSDELYEIIDGQRVELPPMAIYSVWFASVLHGYLTLYARTKGMGRALSEALFRLPAPADRNRRPDVAFVSYQRWPKNRSVPRTGNAWNVVPNVAIEVVSPSDGADELEDKIGEYLRAGVELVWVVYPLHTKVYVHESAKQVRVLSIDDELDGGTVLPGFKLALSELFAEAGENPAEGNGSAVP